MKEKLYPIIVGDISQGFDLFRLGDRDADWMPSMKNMKEFARLLRDVKHPRPFIVYHYGVEIEDWDGTVVFKLGDRKSRWIPTQENQEDFVNELHLNGSNIQALFYHYGVERDSYVPQKKRRK